VTHVTSGTKRQPRLIAVVALITALAGCSSVETRDEAAYEAALDDAPMAVAAAEAAPPPEAVVAAPAVAEPRRSRAEVQVGSGEFINREAASRPVMGPIDGNVTFNFEGESVQAVVKAILGDFLQENYVIAPNVQGTVTFSTSKPLNANQARGVLEYILSQNGLAMVYKDGRYTVLPIGQAIPGNLTPRVGPPGAARGFEIRIVPLSYVAPSEMEKLLQPFVKQGAIVRADNARSLIMLAGNGDELKSYLETIEVFDVDWLAGMSVGVYPLDRVEATTVVPELERVFGEGGATPLAGMFRFLPIERMNAVLVITPQPRYLQEAEKWLARLDRGGADAGAQLFVYYVRNVKAQDLGDKLTEIFTGSLSSGGGQRPSAPIGAVVPGVESVEIRSLNQAKGEPGKADDDAGKAAPAGGGSGGIAIIESEDIRITAIEESNALLIRATPVQYDAILAAIKRLDVVPLQVHIEVKILQVDLTNNLEYGVEWYFENAFSSTDSSRFRVNNRRFEQTGERGYAWNSYSGRVGTGGIGWTFLNTSAEAVITALQGESNVQVLSAPSLVVLNNKEASINVGKQIPVVSSYINPSGGIVDPGTGTGVGGIGQSYVQFRDTGIILSVTPRVNPGGLVFLEIKQEKSTPEATAGPTGNVAVNRSTIETEVAVQSQQTVVLGGLISDELSRGKTGVPGLSKIPIIGGLFGKQTNNNLRQELLVLITPTVIENEDDTRQMSESYRERFRGLKPLIQRETRQREEHALRAPLVAPAEPAIIEPLPARPSEAPTAEPDLDREPQ
jgi:general secretion pathway protein D